MTSASLRVSVRKLQVKQHDFGVKLGTPLGTSCSGDVQALVKKNSMTSAVITRTSKPAPLGKGPILGVAKVAPP